MTRKPSKNTILAIKQERREQMLYVRADGVDPEPEKVYDVLAMRRTV